MKTVFELIKAVGTIIVLIPALIILYPLHWFNEKVMK